MGEVAAITTKSPELPACSTRFAATLDVLPELRRFVRARLVEHSIETGEADRLVLAAHETAANIVRHALRDRPSDEFDVEVRFVAGGVTLRFVHAGSSFDPAGAPEPIFDGSREGGLGLFLIAACVDSVNYDQDDEGKNRINLNRCLNRPALVEP